MDNICHTLVGAALGEAGLKHRARLAVPALLLGANIPDVDVLAYLDSPIAALGFRRGWTHGPVGLLVLCLLLAGLLAGIDRLRMHRAGTPAPAQWGPLFLVTLLAALTHPVLDFLNNYGVRWLIPFDRSWFYGDTLFIVDLWVWSALALGIFRSRWCEHRALPRSRRPAAIALVAVLLYVIGMGAMSVVARQEAARQLASQGVAFDRLMVAPAPLNPFQREVLVEAGHGYRFGRISLIPPRALALSGRVLPGNDTLPMARAAARTPEGRVFLSWSRFPYYLIDEARGLVRIMDARYNADWASVTISVERGSSPGAR